MTRPVLIVDVETNGLDVERHIPFEVSWEFLDGSDSGTFIPAHNPRDLLATAEIEALRINRYIDRIPGLPRDGVLDSAGARLGVGDEAFRLWQAFGSHEGGCTLAGSNPGFDARFLRKLFAHGHDTTDLEPEPWHHRFLDLSNLAMAILGLNELPGLAKVTELLGLPAPDHSAEGDRKVTAEAFRELFRRRALLLK